MRRIGLAQAARRFRAMVSNTGCSSNVERLMTLSTSLVAVCCSRIQQLARTRLHLIEQPRVLDGDDGLSGEVLHQLDLLVA